MPKWPSARDQVAIWCISVWVVALGGVLAFRFLLSLLLEIEPIKEYPSPDGKWVLTTYLLHQNFPYESDFWVNLRPAGTSLRHRQDQIVVYTENAYNADITWESPTTAYITFVKNFGYFGSGERPDIYHEQAGNVQTTVRIINVLQEIDKPIYAITDAGGNPLVLGKIYQTQLEPPLDWKTALKLARVRKDGGSTIAHYYQVLVVDGQYDTIPMTLTTEGITLTLPSAARDAEIQCEPEISGLPINVAYAE